MHVVFHGCSQSKNDVGDAVLDRLVHNAHRIELTGESMRKTRTKNTKNA
jgi:DNA replication protein DnaC